MNRFRWAPPDVLLLVSVVLIGAETALLFLLTAEVAGSAARAPLSWPALWLMGVAAFLLLRRIAAPRIVLAAVALVGFAATTTVSIYFAAYPGAPILDGGRFADVGRALAFQPNGADRNLYLLIATTAAVWAIQLVRSGTDERAPERLFRLGAVPVSVLVFVGLTMWDARTRDFQALTQYVTTFFLLSLGALSLSQWERTRRQSRRGAGAGWATASFLPMLAVIVATLAASALLFGRSAPLLAVVWLLLGGFFAVVVFVAQLVFLPIAEALALLLRPFQGRAQPRPNGVFPTPGPSLPAAAPAANPSPSIWTNDVFISFLLLAMALVLAIAIWGRIRRSLEREPRPEPRTVTRESVTRSGVGLRALLGRLRARLEREGDPLRELLADPEQQYTAQVRMAYRDAQRLYDRAGLGRPTSETAREHAHNRDSQRLHELAAIYEQARYSERPAAEPQAHRARTLRDEIERTLKQDVR